ncbi:MAG: EscS/YscS/HrcS family type III secretion system export apparatus protein, partial [Armatimonadetes bacterium]|nr:EscS/YscS/HrcS family type III secretion system export apparatus protein [Armatimonadota bacterium]
MNPDFLAAIGREAMTVAILLALPILGLALLTGVLV